jgi:hypothetical protein
MRQSVLNEFLDRYQRSDDIISFEIRALATVEMEHELTDIRKDCAKRGVDLNKMEALLAPVTQFLAHPEVELTRSKLEYLITVIKTCKIACRPDA